MQDNDGWTALMYAAHNRCAEVIELLVEYESGVQNKDGWTALMLAAENNSPECVRLLMDKERDIRSTNEIWNVFYKFPPGSTALAIAKKKDMVK